MTQKGITHVNTTYSALVKQLMDALPEVKRNKWELDLFGTVKAKIRKQVMPPVDDPGALDLSFEAQIGASKLVVKPTFYEYHDWLAYDLAIVTRREAREQLAGLN